MRLLLAACAAVALAACSPASEPDETDTAAETRAEAPLMPTDAPPQEEVTPEETPAGAPGACRDTIGEAASAKLVERCLAVSPATRPPCNADNPCALIQGEIDRACALFSDDPPEACAG